MGIFEQSGHDVRLEWGPQGVRQLGGECAALIVVDVLSFSTTVDLVVSRGDRVRPLPWRGERVPRPSALPSGSLDLATPNGGTLSSTATAAHVLAGCLRNATAVAAVAHELAAGQPIGVIPAGERWGEDGSLRPCVEDHLGAGAIVHALLETGRSASPEALIAAVAFGATDLRTALSDCSSGRELIEAGYPGDIDLAAQLDVSAVAPVLRAATFGPHAVD